ncbi:MAG: ABC transporter ATP-binding protein [Nitrososphaeria archaeon]|jgi:ABC-type antimicrobial peptide transport system, ATPase component
MKPDVELINVSKVYGESIKVKALEGINLKVERGEFLSIVGPSGSGKTTLLNILGTLDRPTEGKVLIAGKDTTEMDDDELSEIRNRFIGFVFQAYNLINRLTAQENVELPLIARGVPKKEREKRAIEALNIVGLAEKAKKKPTELSGGEQQRVAIARSLASDPTLILADEPTGNLDSKNALKVMDVLLGINEKFSKTIIMVTHNIELAQMTKKIIRLKDGKIEGVEVLK